MDELVIQDEQQAPGGDADVVDVDVAGGGDAASSGLDMDSALTADDVREVVREVVGEYQEGERVRDESLADATNGKVDTLRADVQVLGARTAGIEDALQSQSETGTAVVVLDSSQWDEVRESWLWAKGGVQLCTTLLFFVFAVGAVMLGQKLYAAFVKGV